MSSTVHIGVHEEHKPKKKGLCENCDIYRCCDPHPGCSLKRNRIEYKMKWIYQYDTQLLTNKDHSDVSDIENNQRRLNREKHFREKYRPILTEIFNFCDNGRNVSNQEKLIKIRNFLGPKKMPVERSQIVVGIWIIWRRKEEAFRKKIRYLE